MFDYDRISKHDFIGEVAVRLESLHPNCIEDKRMQLEAESEEVSYTFVEEFFSNAGCDQNNFGNINT